MTISLMLGFPEELSRGYDIPRRYVVIHGYHRTFDSFLWCISLPLSFILGSPAKRRAIKQFFSQKLVWLGTFNIQINGGRGFYRRGFTPSLL